MARRLALAITLACLAAAPARAQREDRPHPRRDAQGYALDSRLGPPSAGEERRRTPRDQPWLARPLGSLPGTTDGATPGTTPGTTSGTTSGTLSGTFR